MSYKPGTPRTSKELSVNKLPAKAPANPRTTESLFIDKETEIDGIQMGVLSDGTPFLTGRGLARLCGIGKSSTRISEMSQVWSAPSNNAMAEAVKGNLKSRGIFPEKPYIAINHKGTVIHAYSDTVCVAVLEYYAVDAPTPEGRRNFRVLAGKALHDLIYAQVGYDPKHQIPEIWQQFHDRVSLVYNAVPPGYFCVFKEIADIVVHLGQNGLMIDSAFVPDISVGIHWSKHWKDEKLSEKYGERKTYKHNYPPYFPQSASNPQEPKCYPEAALGEFRRWMRESYIHGGKFEKYLADQVSKRALPPSFPQLAIAAYTSNAAPKQLP